MEIKYVIVGVGCCDCYMRFVIVGWGCVVLFFELLVEFNDYGVSFVW